MNDDLLDEAQAIVRSLEQFHKAAGMHMLMGLELTPDSIAEYVILLRNKRDLAAALRRHQELIAT